MSSKKPVTEVCFNEAILQSYICSPLWLLFPFPEYSTSTVQHRDELSLASYFLGEECQAYGGQAISNG